MKNENCILCMISDVDGNKRTISLYDVMRSQEYCYQGDTKEINKYEEIFYNALDDSIYPFVEYDTKNQCIVTI